MGAYFKLPDCGIGAADFAPDVPGRGLGVGAAGVATGLDRGGVGRTSCLLGGGADCGVTCLLGGWGGCSILGPLDGCIGGEAGSLVGGGAVAVNGSVPRTVIPLKEIPFTAII